MDVYLNGGFVDAGEARISVRDAGFQHAVGLFETMGAVAGKVYRLEEHLGRLAHSARELGLAPVLRTEPLAEAVAATLERNADELPGGEARVRLTLTAGSASLRPGAGHGDAAAREANVEPTLLIVAEPPTLYDPSYFERGITVLVAPPSANPFDQMAGHKTLSYWGQLRTLRQAAAAGAGEAIRLSVTHHLACGCVSNVFLVKDGRLLTPIARGEEAEGALGAPVLPGIIRAAVIELAEAAGIATERKMLTVDDLLDADEIFLTNSGWLVLPVTAVEKVAVGPGDQDPPRVGEVTTRLRSMVLEDVAKRCGA